MVGLQQQHCINAVGRKQRVVGLAQDRPHVVQMFPFRAVFNEADGLRIDVYRVHKPGFRDAPGGAHREPPRSRPNIRHVFPRTDAQNVHYAVDLQPIFSPRRIKNGQVAGVGRARLALGLGWRSNLGVRQPCARRGENNRNHHQALEHGQHGFLASKMDFVRWAWLAPVRPTGPFGPICPEPPSSILSNVRAGGFMKTLLCAAVVVLSCGLVFGQQYKVLYAFGGAQAGDGAQPLAILFSTGLAIYMGPLGWAVPRRPVRAAAQCSNSRLTPMARGPRQSCITSAPTTCVKTEPFLWRV
ncbi:hypothetical protein SBA7_10052 [Candidatus Sulfotelmatobacter sp. SbA7]|nr:hypothetical protein SBA7_10052 [Candidatus Sulfotelmatobacter sp. SbA7]